MNTIAKLHLAADHYAALLLVLGSSASIAFGLVWSLHAAIRPMI